MFSRGNRKKTYLFNRRDYYFTCEERLFMYYEMTLMNQR